MEFPTLATSFEHEVLGSEYCSGYVDHFNQWNTGFYCPQSGSSLAVYCCGTSVFKYCCTTKPTGLPSMGEGGSGGDRRDSDGGSGDTSILVSDTSVIVGIACGILAVVILVVVASCFFCSCCLVHKKRSHVPGGMYRMEESSTTSFAPQQTPSVHETLLPNHTLASTTPSTSATASCIENHSSRPIMSILPQPMTSGNLTKPPFPLGLPPVVRSNSLGGSNSPGTLWTEPPHPPAIFHINGSHPRISSHQTSILPPPARFSSNQNLSSYILSDRGNPREIQKLYEYGPTSSPYSGEYLPVNHTSSYGPYPNVSYFPPKMGNGGYCTSTLPSSLRRAGSGSATPSISSGMGVSARNGPGSQQPPLKSILRNPLIPQNSVGGICYPYPQTHPSFPEGDNPVRSYTPMSLGSAGGGRRITTEDFDFGESLLASGSGSDEQEHSYNSYNFPDYSLASQGNNGRIEGANLQVTNYSPGPDLGRYSLNPEYRNDINRLGMTDLDPESLSRLIELDMDSKL